MLRYNNPETTLIAPSYSGNITEWEWSHTPSDPASAQMYAFHYDGLNRLVSTDNMTWTPSENKWNFSLTNFCEYGISYDKNGNFLSFRRNHAGQLLDNIADPVYNGNQLVSIKNNGVASSYAYDVNGNCTTDGLNALKMEYNYLNLTSVAKDMSDNTKAKYTWMADGNKLSVKDGAGASGFEYVGSLIYTRNGSTLALEGASFNNGRIVTTSTGYESNFFLMDHLGSTRVVVAQTTAGGAFTVKERNNFYPFGGRRAESSLTASDNRFRFTGHEDQTLLDSKYMDAGARFLSKKLPVWNGIDKKTEDARNLSPYVYCSNNPVSRIDLTGLKDSTFVSGKDKLITKKTGTETPIFIYDSKGRPIKLHPDAKEAYNCHSYAWEDSQGDPTDSRNSDLVQYGITKWDNNPDNNMDGYTQLKSDDANTPGDKVIYYTDSNGNGQYDAGENIVHSAVVHTVNDEGYTTIVIGKMGQEGISENHPTAPGYYSTDEKGKATSRAYFRK